VNEQEWLAATDLVPMVDFLGQKASQRKLRLFAVTCCRWVTQLGTDTPFLKSLDVAERFADGAATADELAKAEGASNEVYQECEEALSVAASRAVLAGISGQGDDPAITKLQDAADIVSQTTEAVIRGSDFAYTARGCGSEASRQRRAVAGYASDVWVKCSKTAPALECIPHDDFSKADERGRISVERDRDSELGHAMGGSGGER